MKQIQTALWFGTLFLMLTSMSFTVAFAQDQTCCQLTLDVSLDGQRIVPHDFTALRKDVTNPNPYLDYVCDESARRFMASVADPSSKYGDECIRQRGEGMGRTWKCELWLTPGGELRPSGCEPPRRRNESSKEEKNVFQTTSEVTATGPTGVSTTDSALEMKSK